MEKRSDKKSRSSECSMVLYCLLRRRGAAGKPAKFLLVTKQGHPTFPPTKFRPGEDLYAAMVRPMEEDLGLPPGSYFPEEELPVIPNAGESPRYPGLSKQWHLYPVVVSLTAKGMARIARVVTEKGPIHDSLRPTWWSLDEVLKRAKEPNVWAIARRLRNNPTGLLKKPPAGPSMEALACSWAAQHSGGVRVVRNADIRRIITAGSRAFNLRVADPYLPYQKQGLGFTWSFFTPRDKQDLHVHGLPAVEIYGVLEGRLQLWHKQMGHRGARAWQCQTLSPGDWAEVEPLHCHFVCWLDREGLGTVIKAASTGELAGVGRIGVSGKTTCTWKDPDGKEQRCSNYGHCAIPPDMAKLFAEYQKQYEDRDHDRISALAKSAEIQTRSW
jgi:hypothetical protein